MHVKNPLSENMSTRLRMYKVLLCKFRRHLCKETHKTCVSTNKDFVRDCWSFNQLSRFTIHMSSIAFMSSMQTDKIANLIQLTF